MPLPPGTRARVVGTQSHEAPGGLFCLMRVRGYWEGVTLSASAVLGRKLVLRQVKQLPEIFLRWW